MRNMKGLVKKFKRLLLCCLLVIFVTQNAYSQKDKNSELPVTKRVQLLLSQMTLEEKVAQLQSEVINLLNSKSELGSHGIGDLGYLRGGSRLSPKEETKNVNKWQKYAIESSRLGIPALIHAEAMHGLAANEATIFPQSIALASTWNPELMGKVAKAIATECKARGVRQVLSPLINIARDARWGRMQESYGEDPFLTSVMGVEFCKSFEELGVITTPKAFVANVGDGGRDSYAVFLDEHLLYEIYLPAFKACIQQGGARSVMTAYNSLNGLPCSSSHWLLTEILRNQWHFKGFVVSDYKAMPAILGRHLAAATEQQCAKLCLEAGLDKELPDRWIYDEPLLTELRNNNISMAVLDTAVARLLRAKFEIGLFENPYGDPEQAEKVCDCASHRQLALEAARESIVLLKNDNQVLPFSPKLKTIAVLGPAANDAKMGDYSGYGVPTVSILDGLKSRCSAKTKIIYNEVYQTYDTKLPPVQEEYYSVEINGQEMSGIKADYFNNLDLSGNPIITRVDQRVHFSWDQQPPDDRLDIQKFSVRWTGKLVAPKSGRVLMNIVSNDKNLMRFYFDGKLIFNHWDPAENRHDNISFEVTLVKDKKYDFQLEYAQQVNTGIISMQWELPQNWDANVANTVEKIKNADAVIIVAYNQEREGQDRAELDLEYPQVDLIWAVAKLGKPMVVALVNGTAITMRSWIDKAPAIIETWYSGEEGGNAIADVLFGKYNPGGKLPITFPLHVGQCPLYYNYYPSGRGYDYGKMSSDPQFPFGYGLSYTQFEYGNIRLSKTKIRANESVVVYADIKNTGHSEGDEVVQLYIHDKITSTVRPLKVLKGFERIHLKPKEKQTVALTLKPEHLSLWDKDMNFVVEPGNFEIMVGSSSADIRLRTQLEVITGLK